MRNPINNIITSKKPLVYLHTHEITQSILDRVLATGVALELDISVSDTGNLYIGHPLQMYKFKHLPNPNNLPLDKVIHECKKADIFLMFDVKDVRALPEVKDIIARYGAHRCILHACVEELVFRPFSKKLIIEPHWNDEQLPVDKVLAVKKATGVPVALCSRGISEEAIARNSEEAITQKILAVVKDNAEVFVPSFPSGEAVPLSLMQTLLDSGILSLFNVDKRPKELRPRAYFGSTDTIEDASIF